jgi:hypothetical protein
VTTIQPQFFFLQKKGCAEGEWQERKVGEGGRKNKGGTTKRRKTEMKRKKNEKKRNGKKEGTKDAKN